MTLSTAKTIKTLYEQDYNLWLETTVKQLELGQFLIISFAVTLNNHNYSH
ncbi:hypothetical protein [Rippkaea orientalis]|nr:hypothetical protein [Rippkaea orientalis]